MLNKKLTSILLVAVIATGATGCSKQAKKKRYLARAEKDFKAEQYDRAEIEYLAALRIPPPDPNTIVRIGELYQIEGKLATASFYLQEALKVQPDHAAARLKLGQIYLSFGNRKEAHEAAQEVLKSNGEDSQALLLLADSVGSTNDIQEVQQRLDALPQPARQTAAWHLASGAILLMEQQSDQAEAEFKRAVAIDPKSSDGYLALGNLYAARNDANQAGAAFKTASELSGVRSLARLRYAQFKLTSGNTEEARNLVLQTTQKAPDFMPALTFLAQIAFAEHKRDECAALLKKIEARDSLNYDALMLGGNLMLEKGEATNAVAQFERIIKIYGPGPDASYKLGIAYLFNKDVPKSIASLNNAVRASPNFAEATLLLANLHLQQNDPATAVALLKPLLDREPPIAQAYQLIANAYLAQNNGAEALAVYQRMRARFPKSPEPPLAMGAVLVQQRRNAEARQAFETSLQLDADYAPAVEQLVNLDLLDKQYGRALERAQKLLAKHESNPELWLLVGKVHLTHALGFVDAENLKHDAAHEPLIQLPAVPAAQQDAKEAETAILKAVELKPDLPRSYLLLAELYKAANKPQQALERLNTVAAKTNDVMVLMEIGQLQERLKNYGAARDAYEKLLGVNPDFMAALNNLAALYTEIIPNLSRAFTLAERARQLLPNDPSVADTLGWVLYKRGEYLRALPLLEQSSATLGDQPEVRYHAAMAHYMLAEEEPARRALQQALQSNTDFAAKEDAKRRLAILTMDVASASPQAVSDLEKVARENPNDPIAPLRLGAVQERDGKLDQAVETYDAAIKNNPKNAELKYRLAQLCLRVPNQSSRALGLAENAHSLAPDDARISALLGRLIYQSRDYRRATALLEDSARIFPGDPQIAYDLAWCYYSVGRLTEAENAMQVSVKAGQGFAAHEAVNRFLNLVQAAKEPVRASQTAGEAEAIIGKEPGYVPARMVLAVAQENQREYAKAAQSYDRILEALPTFAPANRNRALLYFQHLPDDPKCYDFALKARQALPQDPEIAKVLGILEYRRNEFARSTQLLSESKQSRKDDAELVCYLGLGQYKLKDTKNSRLSLQRALDLNVAPTLADEAKRVLAELQ